MSKLRGKLKQRHRKQMQDKRWSKRAVVRRDPPEMGGMELALMASALIGRMQK